MMKEQLYKPCRLIRITKRGEEETTSWLPVEFAIQDNYVKLRDKRGNWSNGWKIQSASGEAMPEKFVDQASRAHLKHRKTSDI